VPETLDVLDQDGLKRRVVAVSRDDSHGIDHVRCCGDLAKDCVAIDGYLSGIQRAVVDDVHEELCRRGVRCVRVLPQ